MAGINKVILVGNLGKDPDVRSLEGGAKVASFSLATTESFKNKEGQRVDQTEWHNIVMWRGQAELAEKFLKKGMQIYLEGKIRSRSWDDKEGNKRYTTEIIADSFIMLGAKRNDAQGGFNNNYTVETNTNVVTPVPGPDDDLPF